MKAKLIKKDDIFYLYIDESWSIASTDSRDNRDKKLSKQNCDEEFAKAMGIVDVEELAYDYSWTVQSVPEYGTTMAAYKEGFNKAIELNKEKVFTLEDVESAMRCMISQEIFYGETHEETQQMRQTYIKSYIDFLAKEPTEIEVTFNPEEKDSEGCLILKKI